MKNSYRIVDFTALGLPYIGARGHEFCYLDLYEMVGKRQFMTTFFLKENSESYVNYGGSVLGVIHINPIALKAVKSMDKEAVDFTEVQIDSPELKLDEKLRSNLKYEGIKVSDIEFISFLPWEREAELHDTGEKKVPNIIDVEVDFKELNIDADQLELSYLLGKNNGGVELAGFEKEQLIGLLLGKRDGKIDSRILAHLGFDKESMGQNLNVLARYFRFKEKKGTLSEKQKEIFTEIQCSINMRKTVMVLQEIEKSKVNAADLTNAQDALKLIMDATIKFRPSILLHGKKQIYWNLESYLHIVLRHVKHYQMGDFKDKTPFSYKPEELKNLIEQVIKRVEGEYCTHTSERPDKNFTRQGKMAVRFNGDYYHLRIAPDGRLIQFHATGHLASSAAPANKLVG